MLQSRGEGVPLSQLAADADVSERTIQRDFEILQELGFPIQHDEDEYGKRFWRMPYDFFRTGPLVLSLTEAISLHLAERLLMPLSGTYLAEGLQTILDKVRSLVPQKAMDYFAALDETIYVRRTGVTDYSPFAETIRTVADAARDGKTVEVQYRAIWRGDQYTTLFDPYGMVFYDGDLFAVGRSHRADAIRIFKVTRILSADAMTDSFHRPANFSLEDQFRSSFGIFQASGKAIDISVKFSGGAAAIVEERVWHESQQLSWQPAEETLFEQAQDESETLVATFRLSGVVEFKRWIKGFGDQAEIVKPQWLRDELRDELLAAARQHGA
jgi:predicted DNA-binding transcriptional regulator YafY